MFKPLTKDEMRGIMKLQLDKLSGRLADRKITLTLTDAAQEYVIDNGYDPAYGARPLKRFIQHNIETMVAKRIIEYNLVEEADLVIDSDGTALFFKE